MSHSKITQHLQDGTTLNVKGYSHVVCVRNGREQEWIDKGYEIIESHADAHVIGKKKVIKPVAVEPVIESPVAVEQE